MTMKTLTSLLLYTTIVIFNLLSSTSTVCFCYGFVGVTSSITTERSLRIAAPKKSTYYNSSSSSSSNNNNNGHNIRTYAHINDYNSYNGKTNNNNNKNNIPSIYSSVSSSLLDDQHDVKRFSNDTNDLTFTTIPIIMVATTTLLFGFAMPAEAATDGTILLTALWSYAHYFAIMVITGCLIAERTIINTNMSIQDEETIVKIDLLYGLMAVLLIGSGFARASTYGKGGDFYIHDIIFWIKMSLSGIWGGLSIFPSLTFYKRKNDRKNDIEVPQLSDKLIKRLQQIINAEISAILTIPLLATLMSRGVWYWDDFPWQIGLVISILATGGSFFLYGKQALTWKEDDVVVVE